MSRVLFITGSDSAQFPLAVDCIASIREQASHVDHEIAFLDLGCSSNELARIESQGCLIRKPDWEFGIQNGIPALEVRKGQISRPFFPQYFPDHEIFFWIDADAWIQDRSAVDLMVLAARSYGAALVPEFERSSKFFNGGLATYLESMAQLYRQLYGAHPASGLYHYPNLNAGVFCFHRDSHIWDVWKQCLRQTLEIYFKSPRSPGEVLNTFALVDQLALNVGVRQHGLETAIQLLPFTCNWTCHLTLPAFDENRGILVEPYLPHAPVGIVHLTNPWGGPLLSIPHSHERQTRLKESVVSGKSFFQHCRLQTTDGGSVVGSLFRSGRNQLRRASDARNFRPSADVASQVQCDKYDYVSAGLQTVWPDGSFPYMIEGNPADCAWPFLRKQSPHRWYVDRRHTAIGFVSRDEAAILHSTGLILAGKKALEIGCWQGWSACHLAAAGVRLDVVDPILGVPQFRPTIEQSLRSFGVESNVTLHAGQSPEMVERLARDSGGMWSLFFIDGDHEGDAVVRDTLACLPHATQDCIILFHDLMSPDVARALPVLRDRGWNVMVYLTSQIMAVAWRGSVNPVKHTPDPAIAAMQIPDHLAGFPISGLRE